MDGMPSSLSDTNNALDNAFQSRFRAESSANADNTVRTFGIARTEVPSPQNLKGALGEDLGSSRSMRVEEETTAMSNQLLNSGEYRNNKSVLNANSMVDVLDSED